MALLEVNELSVRYKVRTPLFQKQRYLYAVNGVSFTLERGETVGLVGESGCGKSTLGRALVRLEEPCAGEILLDGRDLAHAKGRELKDMRRHFQMIFQDPYGSLNPRLPIFATLDEVIALHSKDSVAVRKERAAELLEMVGLTTDALERYPHQFSGGQRQRIGIARALAADPDFIVADEPVSALDVSVQASIVNLLQDIQQKSNTAILFIAHDLAVVEEWNPHLPGRSYLCRITRIQKHYYPQCRRLKKDWQPESNLKVMCLRRCHCPPGVRSMCAAPMRMKGAVKRNRLCRL